MNRSKAVGTSAESAVVRAARAHGFSSTSSEVDDATGATATPKQPSA